VTETETEAETETETFSLPPDSGSGTFRESEAAPAGGGGDWSDTATLPVAEVRELFVTLSKAVRAVQLYDENNPVYQRFVQSLRAALSALLDTEGSVELRVVGDFFFLNETRLRLDLSNFSTFGSFAQALTEHGIGAVDVTS